MIKLDLIYLETSLCFLLTTDRDREGFFFRFDSIFIVIESCEMTSNEHIGRLDIDRMEKYLFASDWLFLVYETE